MGEPERIRPLNDRKATKGAFVLYWMQASQRARFNHALEYAIEMANDLRLPVVVLFTLTHNYPEANLRHFTFMLQGLHETFKLLRDRGISPIGLRGEPDTVVPQFARKAAAVITDRGYTRHQKAWRTDIAQGLECPCMQVETDAIVPVESASNKEEYAAYTLRTKINRILLRYMVAPQEQEPVVTGFEPDVESLDLSDWVQILQTLPLDRSVGPVETVGGASTARRLLQEFIDGPLEHYHESRSDPNAGVYSGLSPYLHFGQISPLEIALAADTHGGPAADAFLDELIIRRELSLNFVHFNEHYDSFECLPQWTRTTLSEHESDRRPYIHELHELERAGTHDPYWNAAQQEMLRTGTMHNYMRMYWGKKILEWSRTPREAFTAALYLNNRWQLDGRDPNSYAGVAWCCGKHDRPWKERPVFGTVRYMSATGLKRKFDMGEYVARNKEG
ncbi:MAG: deoxyribodipyrimidine photo-lyase [Chloroflexota bacterium]